MDFLKETSSSVIGDIFFGVLLLIIIIVSLNRIVNWSRSKPNWLQDGTVPLIVLFVYLLHRFNLVNGQNWYYIGFKSVGFMKYADVIVLAFIIFSFKPKLKTSKPLASNTFFIEDDIYKNLGIDVFKREYYAANIAKRIDEQSTGNSFAIAITGKWGSGKSVFLDQIRSALPSAQVVQFNPWLSKRPSKIVEDFFQRMAEIVQPYDNSLSKKFKSYSNALLNVEDSFKVKISKLLGLTSEINSYGSLEKQRAAIKNTICEQSLKLIIFIDDLDRLNADEVMAVLSLIRNSFNFPNVFFIVAYDPKYVINLLTSKNVFDPSLFLEKIFQMEIDLPSFPNSILKPELISMLKKEKTEDQIREISSQLDYIDRKIGLHKLVSNLRECVRYANSFNHVFEKKSAQVDLIDFLLVEFIKLNSKEFHSELREYMSTESGWECKLPLKLGHGQLEFFGFSNILSTKRLSSILKGFPFAVCG
jgi:ABC-type lipoprotein export system ATPase subunit